MGEDDARAWLAARVPRGTYDRLVHLSALVAHEASRQNLISSASLADIWSRHIADSAQLADLVPGRRGAWLDVGSGAGFPGIVLAILRPDVAVTLVEPRRRRGLFLQQCATTLALDNVVVAVQRVEALAPAVFDVVSARAVASLDRLFAMTEHLVDAASTYLLPRGRTAADELAQARRSWHGDFALVRSVTSRDAMIVTARDVRPRERR